MGAGALPEFLHRAVSVKPLGIVAALPAEAQCLAGAFDLKYSVSTPDLSTQASIQQVSEHVLLIISGIGAVRARAAASELIKGGAGALLSWGCAGALSPNLKPGDLMIPQIILPQSIKPQLPGTVLHVDRAWHACLLNQLSDTCKPCTGTLADSAHILTEPAQKQALYQFSHAVAVDMESAAIAMVAQHAHIPFLAIRAIADDAGTSIPVWIHTAMDIYGNINLLKLLPSILAQPTSVPRLLRLGRHFSAARATLSQVANATGASFFETVSWSDGWSDEWSDEWSDGKNSHA